MNLQNAFGDNAFSPFTIHNTRLSYGLFALQI